MLKRHNLTPIHEYKSTYCPIYLPSLVEWDFVTWVYSIVIYRPQYRETGDFFSSYNKGIVNNMSINNIIRTVNIIRTALLQNTNNRWQHSTQAPV